MIPSRGCSQKFKNYLTNRRQVKKLNSITSFEIINNSEVPQGSTLGPLLFLLYINDIADIVNNCQIHLLADDTLIYYRPDNVKTVVDTYT